MGSSSRFLSSFSSLHEPSLRPHLRGASVSCLCCDISASSPQVEQPSKCGLPCRRPRYRPLCEGTPIFVRPSRGKWVLALPAVTSFGRLPEQSTTRNLDHRPLFFVIRLSARIAFQALLQFAALPTTRNRCSTQHGLRAIIPVANETK